MRYVLALLALLIAPIANAAERGDVWRPTTVQALPYDAVSVRATTAFGAYTQVIRLACTTSCYIAFGISSNITATAATGTYLPANVPEYFLVSPGEGVAAIRATTTGTLYITEMTK